MRVVAAGRTDVGCVRKHNEDNLLMEAGLGLFVVADGLGGHAAGEVASQIVVERVGRFIAETVEQDRTWPLEYDVALPFDGNRLKAALILSDQAIVEDIKANPERESMGSTVVACLVHGARVTLVHVGDSRAYLLNKDGIRQITRDHSWVAEQVANGILTPEEARKHPFRDGLSGMVSDDLIWKIVKESPSLENAVERLVEKARENGGEDNITVVIVGFEPEEISCSHENP